MYTLREKPNATIQCLAGLSGCGATLDLQVLYKIDRNAAFVRAYGASLSRTLGVMDPDLHNPIAVELLVYKEELMTQE